MKNKKIVNYIKEQLELGHSKEEIKEALLEADWSQEDIDKAFNFLNKKDNKINNSEDSKKRIIIIAFSLFFIIPVVIFAFYFLDEDKNIEKEEFIEDEVEINIDQDNEKENLLENNKKPKNNPEEVVESFYEHWINYPENPNNYREAYNSREELTDHYKAALDDLYDISYLGYDPILCAQDVPYFVIVELEEVRDDRAFVKVDGHLVSLKKIDGKWKINNIYCTYDSVEDINWITKGMEIYPEKIEEGYQFKIGMVGMEKYLNFIEDEQETGQIILETSKGYSYIEDYHVKEKDNILGSRGFNYHVYRSSKDNNIIIEERFKERDGDKVKYYLVDYSESKLIAVLAEYRKLVEIKDEKFIIEFDDDRCLEEGDIVYIENVLIHRKPVFNFENPFELTCEHVAEIASVYNLNPEIKNLKLNKDLSKIKFIVEVGERKEEVVINLKNR